MSRSSAPTTGRPVAGGRHQLAAGRFGQPGGPDPDSSRPSWPPAATSATAAPTRSCWCTFPASVSGEPTTMVSIPRDSYVDIPGYGTDKINAAFAVGGAAAAGPDRRAGHRNAARPLRRDRIRRVRRGRRRTRRRRRVPARADQRSAGRHRPAGGLPEARRPQRARLRPHPRHPAGRPGPDGPPAGVHVGAAAPRRAARPSGSTRGAGTRCRTPRCRR